MPETELDAIDRRILTALQANARLTNVELAAAIGLSPSPCLRRVKRLEQAGILDAYRAELNRAKVGLGLTVFVALKVDTHQDSMAKALTDALNEMPEVINGHIISGDADFLIEVVLPDLAHYEAFLLERLIRLPMVKDARSIFSIRRVKGPTPLPLAV